MCFKIKSSTLYMLLSHQLLVLFMSFLPFCTLIFLNCCLDRHNIQHFYLYTDTLPYHCITFHWRFSRHHSPVPDCYYHSHHDDDEQNHPSQGTSNYLPRWGVRHISSCGNKNSYWHINQLCLLKLITKAIDVKVHHIWANNMFYMCLQWAYIV